MVVAVSLWNIWKARNEAIFKNKIFKPETVSFLSKRDTFRLLLGLGYAVAKDDLLWNVDPLVTLENQILFQKHAYICNLTKSFKNIAFADESWLNQNRRGIGGYIISKDLKVIYVFSLVPLQVIPLRQ